MNAGTSQRSRSRDCQAVCRHGPTDAKREGLVSDLEIVLVFVELGPDGESPLVVSALAT